MNGCPSREGVKLLITYESINAICMMITLAIEIYYILFKDRP